MWWHGGENCTPVSATTISVMLADVAKPLLESRVVLKVRYSKLPYRGASRAQLDISGNFATRRMR